MKEMARLQTVGELKEFLADIPDEGIITVLESPIRSFALDSPVIMIMAADGSGKVLDAVDIGGKE